MNDNLRQLRPTVLLFSYELVGSLSGDIYDTWELLLEFNSAS